MLNFKSLKTAVGKLAKVIFFAILVVYTLQVLISTRAEVAAQNLEAEKISAQISELKQQNDEYLRLIGKSDKSDYMFAAAFERGYAFPGETRFYAKSSKK